jgi:group I intron endonuclease
MGVIYCLTSPCGKQYIGQTRRLFTKRLREHAKMQKGCVALNAAIKMYGFDAFKADILMEVDDSLLNDNEQQLIAAYNTLCPNGYNIRAGGSSNAQHCEESRERMRQSKVGSKNPNFGKPRSKEHCAAISFAKAGEKHHFHGKTLTLEHKLALSASHKDNDLPMYLVKVKARPEHYTSEGYAVVNHPVLPNKYFTSKKLSDSEKFALATSYLESAISNMDAVQRLNGDGSCDSSSHGLSYSPNPVQ